MVFESLWKYKFLGKINEELGKEWITIFRKILRHSKGRKYISIPENYKSLFPKGLPVEVRIFRIISEAELFLEKEYRLPPFTREVTSIGGGRLAIFIPKPVSDFVDFGEEYIVGLRPIYKSEEEKEEKKKEVEKAHDKVQKTLEDWGFHLL